MIRYCMQNKRSGKPPTVKRGARAESCSPPTHASSSYNSDALQTASYSAAIAWINPLVRFLIGSRCNRVPFFRGVQLAIRDVHFAIEAELQRRACSVLCGSGFERGHRPRAVRILLRLLRRRRLSRGLVKAMVELRREAAPYAG